MPGPGESLRPRLCALEKGDNGYGFHLHGERGRTGQFIRLVEPDSPAERSGLRAGDRLVSVNGERVETESHQQVVSRIRATAGRLELLVVDADTERRLRTRELSCRREFETDGVPGADWELETQAEGPNGGPGEPSPEPSPEPARNGGVEHSPAEEDPGRPETGGPGGPETGGPETWRPDGPETGGPGGPEQDWKNLLRPRLCVIQKGPTGYGFNLHSEKTRPGQFIRAIDEDSPAERVGLLPKDRIVQVNGMPVEGKMHSEVVAAIKAGGDETTLLVVDPDTDAFFKKCRVVPSEEHISGPLPEPVVNGDMKEVNGKGDKEVKQKQSKVSISLSPSNASSNTSLTIPPIDTPSLESVEPSIMDAIPALNLSLQQVKERAHQKRSNKRAPPMDWNKKHELFSKM